MTAGRALESWEGRPVDHWRSTWGLPSVVALESVSSTNDLARTLALDGAAAGTLVLAEHQTAGRGRMQRHWMDQSGRSLLLSFIIRPTPIGVAAAARGSSAAPDPGAVHEGAIAPGTVPLRVGMATAAALRAATGVAALLKWPNDVVISEGGKLAGILCEAQMVGPDPVIVAGIGVNVRHVDGDWPDGLRGRAVSIAQLRGADSADRAAILGRLVAALRPVFTAPLSPLSSAELDAFDAIDALAGHTVSITEPDAPSGIAAGIDPDGALAVETAEGRRRITAGSVRITALSHTVLPGSA